MVHLKTVGYVYEPFFPTLFQCGQAFQRLSPVKLKATPQMVCDVFSALKFQFNFMTRSRCQKPFLHIPVYQLVCKKF